jgi:radical SAM protein with 4Fe4S-binding SPASM domain
VNQFVIGGTADQGWTPQQVADYGEQWRELSRFYVAERGNGAPIRIVDFEMTLEERRAKYADRWICNAGTGALAIAPDGSLYPCSRFIPVDGSQGEHWLGDLSQGICRLDRVRELADNRRSIRGQCLNCSYGDLCPGACMAISFATTGSLYHASPLDCARTRIIVDILREMPEVATVHRNRPFADLAHCPEVQKTRHIRLVT